MAGKSTLNLLELPRDRPTRYAKIAQYPAAIEGLFVDLFLEAHTKAPKRITLDLDATDDPLHGDQEGRFLHAYYDCYCYLPLYVFCGRHLLAAKLRPSNTHRRQRGREGGNRPDCHANSEALAARAHSAARRFRLLSRRPDEQVTSREAGGTVTELIY